jgi:SAM-dependent methyltransferase
VVAVDPSAAFASALAERLPGVEVHRTGAESLPLADGSVDLAVAQLVVHFMTDPALGVREMRRVLRDGGGIALSVWDFAGERAPLSLFWRAARELDGDVDDESGRAGAAAGQLAALLREAGFRDVRDGELTVTSDYRDAADWWEPYTLGVGPAGEYLAGLDAAHREAIRRRCSELLGERYGTGPIVVEATAWFATATR